MKRIMGRSWAFVMYPDSMPDNWEEIIKNTGLPMAISPLHNKDIDPTGEEKRNIITLFVIMKIQLLRIMYMKMFVNL